MAPSPKHLSFIFLTFLISSSLIQARESKFFSKFTRDENTATIPTTTTNNHATTPTTTTTNDKETELPEEHAPLGKQDEEPSFIPQTGNGHGLYGRDKNQYSPTTTTNNAYDMYANLPGKTSTEEYSSGSYKYKEFNTDSNNNNNYNYNNNNNNNWSKHEKQGMSDTRFLENGKYYKDSYRNEYQPMSGSYEGFGTSKGVDSTNRYNYGNNDNAYEFNNSKEDPQYQQEGETQDGYIP